MTEIGGHSLYHEYGIVGNMPLDAVCGSEIMKPHGTLLEYRSDGPNVFELRNPSCSICEVNRDILQREQSPQLMYVGIGQLDGGCWLA